MTTAPAPLARSLAPLPHESLAGYVLRLAHRLRRPPGRIGVLTGLAPYRSGRMVSLPAHLLVDLGPDRAAAFAAATRLSPREVAALGLRQYAAAYPPMAQAGTRADGRVGFNVWAFTTASRFCPDCLAGDGSPIEHEHGGAWRHRWHLPVVFACTRHRRLLEHLCPHCLRPANLSYDGRASAILHLQGAGLHPTQCRNLAPNAQSSRPRPLCGTDLTTPDPAVRSLAPAQLTTVLRLQERLDHHLGASTGTGSLFFPDLVAVSQLIKITWPIAADLAPLPTELTDTLDTHIQDVRRRTADLPHGHNGREVIGPPAPAAATAALLAMSENLLAEPDAAILRDAMQTLARTAFDTDRLRYAGIIRRQLSTPLALALSRQQFGFHATAGAGTSGVLRVASRPCRFTPQHVPQLLPTDWYERHLAAFTAHLTAASRSNTRLVRRAAALKLAEMTLGGTRDDGARLLAIPPGHAVSGFKQLRARTPAAHWEQFLAAVEAIAAELDGQDRRIDYARRRAALGTWAIPEEHWAALAAGLPTAHAMRLPASVLVWARVTEGDYLFSPLIRAGGMGPQLDGGADLVCETVRLLGVRRGRQSPPPGAPGPLRRRARRPVRRPARGRTGRAAGKVTGRPLARSLAPLPEESMAGFLRRLSYRVRRTPARTAELAGLGPVRNGRLSTDLLLGLTPATATAFAAATRLTPREVAHLGLRRFEDTYPALKAVPAHSRLATAFFARTWAFTLAPRYCPACLAGDGSPIQDLLGGAWKASWHLPVVFACPAHQRLLAHECPHCGGSPNPIHHRRAALLHRPGTPGIHPLACRGDAAMPGSSRPGACGPVCGARLDQPPPGAHPPPATGGVGRLIGLQQRLQARLHHAGPVPGGAYFPDLAATSQLIALSWPAPADGLTLEPWMLDLIDDHVQTIRAGAQAPDRGPHPRTAPPAAPSCWPPNTSSVTSTTRVMCASGSSPWPRPPSGATRAPTPRCGARTISPRLARALVRHRHGFHAAGRTENGSVRVASRDCRFGPQHVPPYLPQPWYDQHFADFADRLNNPTSYTPRHLRRAVSLKLAEMAAGGSYSQCARLLGIPVAKAASTMNKLRPQMGPTLWRDFEHRVDQIACRLDDDQARVDYTRRRTALTHWQLPAEQWAALFGDLSPRFPRMAGEEGRLTATVLVWTDITQAEYTHSPVLTGLREAGADTGRLVDNIAQTYTPANQKAGRLLLRRRITAYADRLARRLDHGHRPERPTE